MNEPTSTILAEDLRDPGKGVGSVCLLAGNAEGNELIVAIEPEEPVFDLFEFRLLKLGLFY